MNFPFPKQLMVILGLVLGVIFIILQNPPKTLCDVQKKVFLKKNQEFLFKNPKNKVRTQTIFNKNLEDCIKSNAPGGCYSLFGNITQLIQLFRAVDEQCHPQIAKLKEVKQALSRSYALFLEISWGEGPENELSNPLAWLSSNDISTFCRLQTHITHLYGISTLEQLEIKTFTRIAPNQPSDIHRRFSILSENCFKYP